MEPGGTTSEVHETRRTDRASAGYEESSGPVVRRVRRIVRAGRWRVRGLFQKRRTILVEVNWRLGDEIMALPVFEALHARYPHDRLVVLTHYPDLFEGNPAVDAVNPPAVSPDRYILLRGASRREPRLAVYCKKARVPAPEARPRLHLPEWEIPASIPVPLGESALVALAPGASWPSKRWPPARWVALAERLAGVGARVIVLGQAGEGFGSGSDFTGRTTVRDAACLLHASAVCVCCDSGLMHLALAAGCPVVALFGPTDPDFLVRPQPGFTALRSAQSCSGFWNHADVAGEPGVCPEGHACCLESITVDEVWQALTPLLAGGVR
jgi:ADP-heptose:LPS heptosyltransferase